ncbi:MAG: carbamoyl-phosphate synthase (glutamine-hydrolyzing) large subunit [Thermodesulfobacteriota bacterium]
MDRFDKVLILGSSALQIGQAGEFDYSGSQAIKAMKGEGIYTILINPNIATVQTSDGLADKVYFLPVNEYFVEKVIQKEKPDGIILGFGGQTSLNCGLKLNEKGIFKKYNVRVLGTPIEAIESTENRHIFAKKLDEINVKFPVGKTASSVEEAIQVTRDIGFPVVIRMAYALGGLGSGICYNEEEVQHLSAKAFSYTKQILIEEYLEGWKEIEYEVMRDYYNNCICVCNMENFDPLGIHTGESIVVAPSQTLNNYEYHKLREVSIKVIRHLGIVGECNIQFAVDPKSDDYRVIEVNARLSRSSALASKATGYPLALIAAKLSLGFSLAELKNSITHTTFACFEPALDYVVVKIPRWDLKKFKNVFKHIGTGMKSVGEVMAIGRTFEEALQKAIRMLEIDVLGLVGNENIKFEDVSEELIKPTDERIFAIPSAITDGFTIDQIYEMTHINKWFLYKIKRIVEIADELKKFRDRQCPSFILKMAKQAGFSDLQISKYLESSEEQVRLIRRGYGIIPCIKQIDTLAAEYPAKTNYLYLTYNGIEDDVDFTEKNSVIVLGSGAYRIGSSVEFDWCCVNTVRVLKQLGFNTIMINYNPETVSTDYDECDRLYFDELNLETIVGVYEKEKPIGIIVSMGGQIPNSLAMKLFESEVKILGTHPFSIDKAEDREKFSSLLDSINIEQPVWKELSSREDAINFASKIEYPVLVRPSYVLSGAAMGVALNDKELIDILKRAVVVSKEHPIVVSKFIEDAKEIDIDAVAKNGEIIVSMISEHVENAGVHSGDATLVTPPQRTFLETIRQIKDYTSKIANKLEIKGPFNIQFIAKGNKVSVIECNLRASRSFPFVSKVYKTNLIETATKVIMDYPVEKKANSFFGLEYCGVKAPQFSFTRLHGADPVTGVEMASTGEVGCIGEDFEGAFLKSLISVGFKFPIKSVLLSTGPLQNKVEFLSSAKLLSNLGMTLYATRGTADFLKKHGIETTTLFWPLEEKSPNVVSHIEDGKIDLVINIPKNTQEEELTNDYIIRRKAVDFGVSLITNIQLANRFAETLANKNLESLEIKSWDEY